MILSSNSLFALTLEPCTSAILAHALDPAVPWIWIRRHTPKRNVGWWRTQLPLADGGALHEVGVRSLEFDLQLPTSRFLELLPEFQDHALALFQMTRPVPDKLTLDRVSDEGVDGILVQNGLHLAFHLPHAFETAQFRAPRRETLAALLDVPQIRALVNAKA